MGRPKKMESAGMLPGLPIPSRLDTLTILSTSRNIITPMVLPTSITAWTADTTWFLALMLWTISLTPEVSSRRLLPLSQDLYTSIPSSTECTPLLSFTICISKLHIHSADLAKTLMGYMATMRGGSFGWVAQITTLLKTHLKMEVNQMHSLVAHHRLVYKLHSIIRHAAMRSHRQIHKLYAVMHKHGFMHKGLLRSRRTMITTHHHIMRKIRHVFRTHRVHTSVVRHTTRTFHTSTKHYSFRSSHSTSRSVRILLKKHSIKTAHKMLTKMLKRAKTTATKRHIKKALKLVKKVAAKKAKKAKK